MADEYIIPFGVDSTSYIKGIGAMEDATDGLTKSAEKAGAEVQATADKTAAVFSNANKIVNEYGQSVKSAGFQVKSLSQLTEQLATLQSAAFNSRQTANVATYNKLIQQTQQEIKTLQSVGKEGFDALGNSLTKTAASANVLSKGFGFIRQAAYLIPGIGIAGIFNLIGEAVVSLIGNLAKGKDSFDAIADKMKAFNEVNADANKAAGKQITDLKILYTATQNVALSIKDRTDATKALQAEFPEAFKNYTTEEILNGKAKVSYDELTLSILATARATAAKAKLDALASQQLDLDLQKQKIINATNNELAQTRDRQKSISLGGGTLGGGGASVEVLQTKAEQDEIIRIRRDAALKEVDIQKTRLNNQENFYVQFAGGEQALTKTVEDANAKKVKSAEDLTAKQEAEAAKQAKILADQLKTFQTLLEKGQNLDNSLQATAIQDDRASALAASDAKYKRIVDDYQRSVDQAKVSNAQRAELQKVADQVELDAMAANAAAKLDINKNYDDKLLKLREAAEKALESISLNSQERELTAINKKYADIIATVKKGGLYTQTEAIRIENARLTAIEDNTIKYGTKAIDDKEKTDIEAIEVDQKYAKKTVALQKEKNIAILNVELKAAEDRLALLKANGKTENDESVKNAVAVIKNLKAAINTGQSGKPQSLFEFLGIDPEVEGNIQMYAKAASTAGQITSDFFGVLADQQQQYIDAAKERVDQDEKDLEDLQNRLDKETELRDQGLANNVDNIQKEIDAKKKARDEDVKSQKEAQDKMNALKKAQIIADSIAQVSNLITAASEIFAAFSSIPFVGVPLAIAAVGLMLGSFVAAKVNAFKAVDSGQQFGEGGLVDGKSHSEGGRKYRSIDGRGGVVELEGGEHVTNKKSTRKYLPILEAINSGELSQMSEAGLHEMFRDMGIGYQGHETTKEAVKIVHQNTEIRQTLAISDHAVDTSKDIKAISGNVSFLAESEKNRIERWEDDSFYYTKKGQKTSRIAKPKP